LLADCRRGRGKAKARAGGLREAPEEFVSVVDQDDGNHPRLHALLADASLWQFLRRLDDDLAAAARAGVEHPASSASTAARHCKNS